MQQPPLQMCNDHLHQIIINASLESGQACVCMAKAATAVKGDYNWKAEAPVCRPTATETIIWV